MTSISGLLDRFAQDARYAVRSLRRAPIMTTVVITTLSVGIAAITTFFSFVNTAVLRKLPYLDADRIVLLYKTWESSNSIIDELAKSTRAFERLSAYAEGEGVIVGQGEPLHVSAILVDSGFFPLLRPTPLLGVLPSARDVQSGAPILVIGERIWRTKFDAAPDILGRVVTVHGHARQIVAVLKRDFTMPYLGEVWLPVRGSHRNPDDSFTQVLGKFAPGATRADAQRDLDLLAARLHAAEPATYIKRFQFWMAPEMLERVRITGYFTDSLKMVMWAAAGLLLIVCTNVAMLMLARGARRRGEMVVRASLGASRWRLMQQQLMESSILALSSGVIGTLMSLWGIRLALVLFVPNRVAKDAFPGWMQFGIDWRVALFGVAVALLTVSVFGVWPVRAATRFDLSGALRATADHGISGADPTRSGHLPIVVEVTMSLALFAGAMMLAVTYREVARTDRGYRPQGLYEAMIGVDGADTAASTRSALFRHIRNELQAVPGIAVALSARFVSYNGEQSDQAVYLPDRSNPVVSNTEWRSDAAVVSDNYFQLMGMPMMAGRSFSHLDAAGTAPVAVVSHEFAMKAWGIAEVIGKTLLVGRPSTDKSRNVGKAAGRLGASPSTLVTVVGVVGDIRKAGRAGGTSVWSRPDVYLPDQQAQFSPPSLMVRAATSGSVLRTVLLKQLTAMGVQASVDVNSSEIMAEHEVSGTKSLAVVLFSFAAVSLGLALIGVYGIVAFGVEQRTREIGIRTALGARPSQVILAIMTNGTKLIATGLGLGFVVAAMMGQVMSGFVLGGVTAHIAIAGAATGLFGVVALAAAYLPARRAARLDPVVALRS